MNSENNLIRKIFSIGIAYLVALAGIELYVYKIEGNPVYSGKITSNIIPYAVFLLVFCLLVCIIMNIPAVKNSTNDARNTMPDRIPSTAPDAITRNLHIR